MNAIRSWNGSQLVFDGSRCSGPRTGFPHRRQSIVTMMRAKHRIHLRQISFSTLRPIRTRLHHRRRRRGSPLGAVTVAMVNVDVSPSVILGVGLIGAGVSLWQIRQAKPWISRDYDVVISCISLLVGGILIFQGWRLDPLLLFGQLMTTGAAVSFAIEALKLRAEVYEDEERIELQDVFQRRGRRKSVDLRLPPASGEPLGGRVALDEELWSERPPWRNTAPVDREQHDLERDFEESWNGPSSSRRWPSRRIDGYSDDDYTYSDNFDGNNNVRFDRTKSDPRNIGESLIEADYYPVDESPPFDGEGNVGDESIDRYPSSDIELSDDRWMRENKRRNRSTYFSNADADWE